jgi:5'-methylthioadenosine phosphorylase
MSKPIALAIIGGSGLYDLEGLEQTQSIVINTPFGQTSAPILVGELDGVRIAFLARHGMGHHLSPSEVPYRANIFALKTLGTERILSISACGSLREDLAPGDVVVPDQLFDHTRNRDHSFFGDGIVAHLSAPEPFCPQLSRMLVRAAGESGGRVHPGGTMITIEGPRFSTKAESGVYRKWDMDLIGMTTTPEAFLAREGEMCYAVMAHITDYDVWHESAGTVTVETVVQTLARNTALARATIRQLVSGLEPIRSCACPTALAGAILTGANAIPREAVIKLGPIVSKYIPG